MNPNFGQIGNIFFFLSLSFFLFLSYLLFEPFLKVLILSILISIIFHPLNQFFRKKLKNALVSSLLSTVIVFLFIIIPSIFLVVFLSNEFLSLYPVIVKNVSEIENLNSFIQKLPVIPYIHQKFMTFLHTLNVDVKFDTVVRNMINNLLAFFINQSKSIFVNITIFIFDLVMMLMTIFFLFKEGEKFYSRVYELIPLPDKEKSFLVLKTYRAIQGVVLGSVFTAIAQGILSFIGYFFLGIKFSLFWAFMTFIAAFLPIGGAALVWVPIAVYSIFAIGLVPGIIFTLYGTFVVSIVDNIIKPVVIGDKTNIHPIVLVFAILGGLKIFGFLGVFLAPIILVLVDNLLVLFKQKYVHSV